MSEKASLKRLQLSNFKLDSLLNITQAINENLSTEGLLKRYEKVIREDLGIGKVVFTAIITPGIAFLLLVLNTNNIKMFM